jgi:hypothetical protein
MVVEEDEEEEEKEWRDPKRERANLENEELAILFKPRRLRSLNIKEALSCTDVRGGRARLIWWWKIFGPPTLSSAAV